MEMSKPKRRHRGLIWMLVLGGLLAQASGQGSTTPQAGGWMDEAIAAERKKLEALEQNSVESDPKTVPVLYRLARLLYERGDYTEAQGVYVRAGKIQIQKLGALEHPEVAVVANHLAEISRAKGDYSGAEQSYRDVLQLLEKAAEPDQVEMAISLNGLAEVYRLRRDYARAEPLYTRALAIWEKTDSRKSRAVETLNNLGQLYRERGDLTLAEQFFQRAVEAFEKKSMMNNIWNKVSTGVRYYPDTQVAAALLNLAELQRAKGELTAAEPLYRRALEIREKAFGPQHRFVAEPLNQLALLSQAKGDAAQAEQFLRRARAIYTGAVESRPKTDLERAGLTGPVRSVLVEAGASDDTLVRRELTTYDPQGNLTEYAGYQNPGTLERREVYTYEKDGRLKERLRYDSKNSLVNREAYSYDASGKRTESAGYNADGTSSGKTVYNYDARGNPLGEKGEGTFFKADVTYKYDEKGRLVEKTSRSMGGVPVRHTYKYGDADNLLEEEIDHSGSGLARTTTRYDDRGNKVEVFTTLGTRRTETYAYEYDSHGNWIRQTATEKIPKDMTIKAPGDTRVTTVPGMGTESRPAGVVRRTIVYY
jgi:YD repeat-containing protein